MAKAVVEGYKSCEWMVELGIQWWLPWLNFWFTPRRSLRCAKLLTKGMA